MDDYKTNFLFGFDDGSMLELNTIFRLHYRPLCYYAYKIINNEAEAEDIVSETFLKISKSHSSYKTLSDLRIVLYRITRNGCIDFLRKKKVWEKAFREIPSHSDLQNPGGDRELVYAQVLQLIYAEIEQLPEQCRKVFKGIYIDGKDTTVLAEELRLSKQTVLNHKSRAIQLLRLALYKEGLPDYLLLFLFSIIHCS